MQKGDICIYHFADGNGSVSVVQIEEKVDEIHSRISFKQVVVDNSGNGFFHYLHKTGKTMLASNEYLFPLYCNEQLRCCGKEF